MGTWGPGNFENDSAADHLHEVCQPLLDQIEATVANTTLMEPDSAIMMCNLEMLACLSEHLGRYAEGPIPDALYPCVLPPPNTIAEWKTAYLQVWDGYIDGLDPDPDYKRVRRSVLVNTFDRLERVSKSYHEPDE